MLPPCSRHAPPEPKFLSFTMDGDTHHGDTYIEQCLNARAEFPNLSDTDREALFSKVRLVYLVKVL